MISANFLPPPNIFKMLLSILFKFASIHNSLISVHANNHITEKLYKTLSLKPNGRIERTLALITLDRATTVKTRPMQDKSQLHTFPLSVKTIVSLFQH